MNYEIETAPSFDARLDEALAHRLRLFGEKSSRKLAASIEAATALLATSPYMGTPLNGDSAKDSRGEQLRWVLAESYVIVYSVNADDEVVMLRDFFYGHEDWRTVVEGPDSKES